MKKILSLICILTFITGCDPQSKYKKIVHNETNHAILVVFYSWSGKGVPALPKDSSLIEAGNSLVLRNGTTYGDAPCKLPIDDSIVCKVANTSDVVNTNLNDEKSWIRSSSGNSRKGYFVECKAIIKNTDIVAK